MAADVREGGSHQLLNHRQRHQPLVRLRSATQDESETDQHTEDDAVAEREDCAPSRRLPNAENRHSGAVPTPRHGDTGLPRGDHHTRRDNRRSGSECLVSANAPGGHQCWAWNQDWSGLVG